MSAALPRAVLALAMRCLPECRRGWGMAMAAEFEAASEDGRALSFALGCLAASWREMPVHADGRRVIVGHGFALGVLLPAAALLLASVADGLPGFHAAEIVLHAPAAGVPGVPVTDANVSAVPGLVLLVLLLVGGHLRLAWMVVERDWSRVRGAAMLNAAAAVTLVAAAGVLFLADPRVLVPAGMVLAELAAVAALARWHERPPWLPAGSRAL